MRTEADLRAAAAAAGLTVDLVERVPVAGGRTALAARMRFSDPWAAARLLYLLSEEDAADPSVRAWSLAILKATARQEGLSLGPTITGELRDAFARALHANVQAHVKFLHEPEETFQSAAVTMQTGAGDCDDHARLLYALAGAGGVPAKLVFFEEPDTGGGLPTVVLGPGTQPVHVVAMLQDSDSTWRWAETTIDAAYGEEPHEALARLDGDLPASQNPFAHSSMSGPFGFVTAADVQARKDQVNVEIESTTADVVGCATLDMGTKSAWSLFLTSWTTFYANEPGFFSAGAQGRQVADYVDELAKYQEKFKAAGCSLSSPGLPVQPQDDVSATVKVVAIAVAVAAAAYAAAEVARAARR